VLLGLHCNKNAAPLIEGGASLTIKPTSLTTFLLYHELGRSSVETRSGEPTSGGPQYLRWLLSAWARDYANFRERFFHALRSISLGTGDLAVRGDDPSCGALRTTG
jgi:hypothetical protein